jgi:uncharacterized protein (DUF2267 family)
MQYAEFIKHVQQQGNFASHDEALLAAQISLQVLAERLAGNEANNLFAQLPRELVGAIHHRKMLQTENYDLDEFLRRVSERAGVDQATASQYARAVMAVLITAVSPGEMRDVFTQLPKEFASLVDTGSGEDVGSPEA